LGLRGVGWGGVAPWRERVVGPPPRDPRGGGVSRARATDPGREDGGFGFGAETKRGGAAVLDKQAEKVSQGDPTQGKPYKVLLHNDPVNRRDYVVKVLVQVVEGFTVDEAYRVMEEAHTTGVGLVCVCGQTEAEDYVDALRTNGLTSSMEPDE